MPKVAKKPTPLRRRLSEPEAVVLGLEERAFSWVRANQKVATVAAVVLVTLVSLFIGARKYSAYKEDQAMVLFGQAQAALGPEGSVNPSDAGRAMSAFQAVAGQYPNTKAGCYAKLEEANLLYGAGRTSDAAKLYQGCVDQLGATDEVGLLAKQGLAYCELSANDLAGAQKLFIELAAAKFGAGTAQLNLGLVYERQGKLKEALAAYQLAAKLAKGPEGVLANARLEALQAEGHGGA